MSQMAKTTVVYNGYLQNNMVPADQVHEFDFNEFNETLMRVSKPFFGSAQGGS